MVVGISVCWCIDKGVGAGNGSDDVIKSVFNSGYDFVYSYGLFDSFSVDKYIFRSLYESIELNDGSLPDLYEVVRDVNKVEKLLVRWLIHC